MPITYEDLEKTLNQNGQTAAVSRLCSHLRETKDYHGLFYAMLLQKRLDLGLPPMQIGSSENMPDAVQEPYEEAIREAARTIGNLFLEQEDIAGAWPFFRMINEPSPIASAIDKVVCDDSEKCQQIIEIALHQGANPQKGFSMVLQRYGICSAITMLSQELPFAKEVRDDCVKQLVRALYAELCGRIVADIEHRNDQSGGRQPPEPANPHGADAPRSESLSVRELIRDRDYLFADESYHIDISHLSSVVRFSLSLPDCEEQKLAIELCEYGLKLSTRYRNEGPTPFEETYRDEIIYLNALIGEAVESAIAHFRAKVEKSNPEETGTIAAEAFVNLLVRLKRIRDAVDVHVQFLAEADGRQLSCPTLAELCQQIGDYQPVVEVARRRGDWVQFTAGLLQVSSQ